MFYFFQWAVTIRALSIHILFFVVRTITRPFRLWFLLRNLWILSFAETSINNLCETTFDFIFLPSQ